MFKDKYYGRDLTVDGFHRALHCFLHSGTHLRSDIIPDLVEMLRQLKEQVAKQDSFRFFSSSLLIIYDGRVDGPTDLPKSSQEEKFRREGGGLSGGEGVRGSECEGVCGGRCDTGEGREGAATANHEPNTSKSCDKHTHNGPSRNLTEARKFVDVRMIDFAHTTHSLCLQDPVKYSGPDQGCILGLDTLISAFKSMEDKS